MKVIVFLGHPAHFHMMKHVVRELRGVGACVRIVIKRKDVLEDLLRTAGWEYVDILPPRSDGERPRRLKELIAREVGMWRQAVEFDPDILVGTSAEVAHVAAVLRKPSIIFSEDDYAIIPRFANLAYPFATAVCSPTTCHAGPWEHKKLGYPGFQKLACLHPRRFSPDESRIDHLRADGGGYSIVRLVALTAHHDVGVRGLSVAAVRGVVRRLETRGPVYISAEGPIDAELETRRLPLAPSDIHHALFFADFYVGDSQSMAVEAAVLGTPSLRMNDFAGRIGVLDELELRYRLTYGFLPDQTDELIARLDALLALKDLREEWRARRDRMLADMIDVTAFWVWLIENAPDSLYPRSRPPRFFDRFR